jgi:copper(I)-binding protein
MHPVVELALPAGQPVELEPGGSHVMLIGLADPLEVGESFDLTLQFTRSGDQVVRVEIRP